MAHKPSWNDPKYGLSYHCVDKVMDETLYKVDEFKAEFHISDKNFKYVQDKLFLHYFFDNVMIFLRVNYCSNNFKPVLFLTETRLLQPDLKSESIIKQLKLIKKLLPIPLIIPLSTQLFKAVKTGELKELNERITRFYEKRRVSSKKLKSYFDEKGYNTLSATLSSVVNLRYLLY